MRYSLSAVIVVLLIGLTADAQVHRKKSNSRGPVSQVAEAGTSSATALPVRRVVLYKNGIGYFEHAARVRGNQDLTFQFTTAQLDDVLKSLTAVDLGGGRITGVRYNSTAPLGDALRSLQIPLGEDATRAKLLSALRGTRVEVRSGSSAVTGKLLSVENARKQTSRGDLLETTEISLVTDGGEIRSYELNAATSVRVAEPDIKDELGRYLNLVGSTRARDTRRMTIGTEGVDERELFVSYISEVPVWKSTYRILFPSKPDEKPLLQGWAIVDNTVGEDWKDVQLSLIAGNPQSFVQQTSQPYYVRRPVVPLPQATSLTPQAHEATLMHVPAAGLAIPEDRGAASLRGVVKDMSGAIVANASVTIRNEQTGAAQTTRTNVQGEYFFSNVQAGNAALFVEAPGFQRFNLTNFYLGIGRTNTIDATLNVGTTSQTVEVTASAPVVNTTSSSLAMRRTESEADANSLGDFFEYAIKHKVTVLKNQSALVPILSTPVDLEKVTLWSESSGEPLRALWLHNTSGLNLDGGTVEVVDQGAFGGEAIIEPIHPMEKRLISYAVDNAVRVRWEEDSDETPATRIRIAKGIMKVTRFEKETKSYTIHNADTTARQVIIEHPSRSEWKLADGLKPEETSASFHRFRVAVAPGTTEKLIVEELKPDEESTTLTNLDDDTVALFVKDKLISVSVEQAFRRILTQKHRISSIDQDLKTREQEIAAIDRDQTRVRENMKALKGSAEEKALVQRYARQFAQQEDRLVALRKEITDLHERRQQLHAELDRIVEEVTVDDVTSTMGR